MMKLSFDRQRGFMVLLLAGVLMTVMTIIAALTGVQLRAHTHALTVGYQSVAAFEAAQAGLEYGMAYLNEYYKTVVDNTTLTMNLPAARFTVTIRFNPNKENIQLIAEGVSPDGAITRVIRQQVYFVSDQWDIQLPRQTVVNKGAVELVGNAALSNPSTAVNIVSGDQVGFTGNAHTETDQGRVSSRQGIGDDVIAQDPVLQSVSASVFEENYLGQLFGNFQGGEDYNYENTNHYNYSATLDGVTGKQVWITQSGGQATINGKTTIGTSDDPVTIFVNGPLSLSGNVVIYGNIITNHTVEFSGNAKVYGLVFSNPRTSSAESRLTGNAAIHGAFIGGGQLIMTGNSAVTFDPEVLKASLGGLRSGAQGQYAKRVGTWNDMGY